MPYEVTRKFEQAIADYCGSKYAVAVESCTNAIFLCLEFLKAYGTCERGDRITLPHKTYVGVACSCIHAGMKLKFNPERWTGIYQLYPTPIWDSALRFKKNMYIPDSLMCLSFHVKKHIPIGRGGMILCNNPSAYEWLKRARFDGRNECPLIEDNIQVCGWNMYMTPDQASRGLMLFETIKNKDLKDKDDYATYPDLSKIPIYWKYANS